MLHNNHVSEKSASSPLGAGQINWVIMTCLVHGVTGLAHGAH